MVTHTPDVLNAEVATTAIMLLMVCYRELLRDEAWVRSGNWAAKGNAPLTRSLDNQTIGILGMGRIGQEIARKLEPWNPLIIYHTRTPKDVPYEHVPDLVDMARRKPASMAEFAEVHGVGAAKQRDFAAIFLAVVNKPAD